MENKPLSEGIKALLSREKIFDLFLYRNKEAEKLELQQEKVKKNLNKGQKIRAKNISKIAKQNKKILLEESKRIKKLNPSIKRKALASQLENFSKNYKSNGLSKPFSFSHIYKEILT